MSPARTIPFFRWKLTLLPPIFKELVDHDVKRHWRHPSVADNLRMKSQRKRRYEKRRGLVWGALFLTATMCLGISVVAKETKEGAPSFLTFKAEDRELAEEILADVTLQAERQITFLADARVFAYLIDHPDLAAELSRGIGHERFHVWAKEDRYQITHGYATGTFWTVDRTKDRVVYLAKGVYGHPALRLFGIEIRARSYVVESFSGAAPRKGGSGPAVQNLEIRAYLNIENPILGRIFEWAGPLIRTAFESKLTAAYRIAPDLSQMAYEDREKFLEKLAKVEGLDEARLRKFRELVKKGRAQQAASQD